MAKIKGTNVIAPVVPLDTADVHPSHEARWGKGGFRTVATTSERDAIPAPRREPGMLVYVQADEQVYQLGEDGTTWSLLDATALPHAATHGFNGTDPITVETSQVSGFTAAASAAAPVQSVAGRTGAVALAKADVGLGNVDNTSDASKPVSTAQAAADAAVASAAAADATSKANAAQAAAVQRANHTGTQAISTVTGLQAALDSKATPADVSTAVAGLVNSAPAALDTLNELAAALGNDANFASTVTTALAGKVATSDARLTDAREWSAATIDQAEAEAGTGTTRRAFTAQRVFQAVAAWWAGSAAKTKLDGIATGATANATDAQLRDRSTHTGTQTASTISDFTAAVVAAAPPTTNASLLTSGTLPAARLPATTVSAGSYGSASAVGTFTVGADGRLTAAGSTAIAISAGAVSGLAAVATSGSASDLSAGTVPFARLPVGTSSTTVAAGNDSRLSDSRTPTAGSVTDASITSGGLSTSSLNWAAIQPWAANTAYAKGDLVSNAGIAYRRSAAGTSGATFNVANWQQITPSDFLASQITSGTIATARLGSGTASASTFLRGDQTYAAPPVTSVDGLTGAVSLTKADVFDFTPTSAPSGATGSSGSWTWALPSGAKAIRIWAISAGTGGGSGRRGAAGTNRFGGGGGVGGTAAEISYRVADLPSTTLGITVRAGGAGGAAVTTDDTNGNAGGAGSASQVFCNGKVIFGTRDTATTGGAGGTATSGTGRTSDWGSQNTASSYGNTPNPPGGGGNSSVSGTPSQGGESWFSAGGGGAGGGIDSSNVARPGGYAGLGSSIFGTYSLPANGAAGGGAPADQDLTNYLFPLSGWSGNGGGGNASGAGGNGGDGLRPGCAGGGGGASVNGFASGRGGNGGPGHVRITVWY